MINAFDDPNFDDVPEEVFDEVEVERLRAKGYKITPPAPKEEMLINFANDCYQNLKKNLKKAR